VSKSLVVRGYRRRPLRVAVLAAIVSIAIGCRPDPDPAQKMTPLERRGERVFTGEQCFYHCHTFGARRGKDYDARDARAGLPPDLPKAPRRTADWYRAYIVDPRAVLPQSPMPSRGNLSRKKLDALVAFLEHQNQQPHWQPSPAPPPAVPETGNGLTEYTRGRALYGANCVGCHGEWGNGGGPVGQLLVPEPRNFTDSFWMSKQSETYLFSVISDGKPNTAMAGFKDLLTKRERALVMRYVEYFANPVAKERIELSPFLQKVQK